MICLFKFQVWLPDLLGNWQKVFTSKEKTEIGVKETESPLDC